MKAHILFLQISIFSLLSSSCFAQYENHLWLFGHGQAGVKFDQNNNEIQNFNGHHPLLGEGSGVANDPVTGKLLFYTDGINVYNSSHIIMLNGENIGTCRSSAQSTAICLVPGYTSRYFIFVNGQGHNCVDNDLTYAVVDISEDNGLGKVISKNNLLISHVNEGLIVVPKPCPGEGYWLIVNGGTTDATHYILSVADETPVLHAAPKLWNDLENGTNNLQYSLKRGRIAFCRPQKGQVGILDFSVYAGIIHSYEIIAEDFSSSFEVEFSPDGSKLYYSSWKNIQLKQYDLNTRITTTLYSVNDIIGGGLRTGPDGKIYYISDAYSTKLGVIQYPNLAGLACSFSRDGVDVQDTINTLNFPEMLVPPFPIPEPPTSSPTGEVINHYTAVQDFCGSWLKIKDPVGFDEGDPVLMVQMQGAQIDTSNTVAFGTVLDYGNAGNYELNEIKSVQGNNVYLKYNLLKSYDIKGKVQLISVPDVGNGSIGSTTCLPWNGQTGGVLAFTGENIQLMGNIDVSDKGFRGGKNYNINSGCHARRALFYESSQIDSAAEKGEGIAIISDAYRLGRGPVANGGGSGNNHNGGGGGGANWESGGQGSIWIHPSLRHGNEINECTFQSSTNGIGGGAVASSIQENKVFMGGGGGGGHSNNNYGVFGGNGGGIILIWAKSISSAGYEIRANGETVYLASFPDCLIDGGGGGGAGGSVLLHLSEQNNSSLSVAVKGGDGQSVHRHHGQGGGGGGGLLWINKYPAGGIQLNAFGGHSGQGGDHNPRAATGGKDGTLLTGLEIPKSTNLAESLQFDEIKAIAACDGNGSIQISSKGGYLTNEYAFNNGEWSDSVFFDNLVSGEYHIQLRDACQIIDTAVQLITYPVLHGEIIYTEPVRCDSLGKIELFQAGGAAPFQYKISGDNTWRTDGLFEQLQPDFYELIVRDRRGCSDTLEYEIIDDSYRIRINLPSDTTTQRSRPFQLPVQVDLDNENWEINWQPNEGISCTDCLHPVFQPSFTTEYTLSIRDYWGCIGTAQTRITIEDITLYYPNAFSPNNDSDNDYFYLMSAPGQVVNITQFHIFDRWGNKLFTQSNIAANDASLGWDGTYRGRKVPVGVYVFYMEVELADGTKRIIKDSVTITLI